MKNFVKKVFGICAASLVCSAPLTALNTEAQEFKIEQVRTSFEFGINYGYPYYYYNYYPYCEYYPYYDYGYPFCDFGFGFYL